MYLTPNDPRCRPVNVDAHFFGERDTVQLRSNLMDGQIQICAPEVLMLFTDNFDYQVNGLENIAWQEFL